MASDSPTPPISAALVEYVERVFPNRCPDLNMDDRQVWFAAGQADVARKLRYEHNNQTKRAMTS